MKLDGPKKDSDFVDPRNCLVFWARPPKKVRDLIGHVQSKLQSVAPSQLSRVFLELILTFFADLWLMPPENLHMTALEVTHSLTSQEVDKLVDNLRPNITQITDFTYDHRARLVKPMISYDNAALALSLLPAAGETLDNGRTLEDDGYTYHHLRRDLYNLCSASGVTVGSRYVVPSAHFTIARFISQDPFSESSGGEEEFKPDAAKLRDWIGKIEDINTWLQQEYWPKEGNAIEPGGEWVVGEEKGLDCRRGRLWYGGGETIKLGKGF
jgi:hypothetical protein